ncbi:MAG TPA: B-box zinc finger protein [Acidobacteriaceae bacterium]|nr:B-box zinc finger protein [Acidobacteriaceae bacterium]
MNCVNHPEAAATAFCQDCGKALCGQCTRTIQGSVYCEPCLVARAAAPGVAGAAGSYAAGGYAPGFPPPTGAPNPGTAAVLGFIPGVGAMYNGQYIKALVHVLVFVVLVGISGHVGLFGILLAAWVLYQVFDAHQTAKARRDGLPLPDPFGLNELGNAIGGHSAPRPYTPPPPSAGTGSGTGPGAGPGVPPYVPVGAVGAVPGDPAWAEQVKQQAQAFGVQAGQWGEQLRQRIVAEASQRQPGYPGAPAQWSAPPAYGASPVNPPGSAYPPPPGPGWGPPPVPPVPPEMELERARREPIGAIVLIVLGMLFLFNTLGFFNFNWLTHGWPLVIVAIAIWMIMRNSAGRFGWGSRMGPPSPVAPVSPVEPPNPVSTNHEPPTGGGQ